MKCEANFIKTVKDVQLNKSFKYFIVCNYSSVEVLSVFVQKVSGSIPAGANMLLFWLHSSFFLAFFIPLPELFNPCGLGISCYSEYKLYDTFKNKKTFLPMDCTFKVL